MTKAIREAYGEALVKYGKDDPRVVVLDADVSSSTKSGMFAAACPQRFINCGIAENAMMGMAAGLAAGGKIPFVNAFGVFLETIGALVTRTYLSYSHLNVKLMGGYAGLSAGYDGSTHHCLEDLAIMRAMPGLTVLVASDERLTDWLVKTAIEYDGPMYIRLSREASPVCHDDRARFALGKGIVVRDGGDGTIIACGRLVSEALTAAQRLSADGIEVRVIDMFCIKPLDTELVEAAARETGAIVTAEEHNTIGGLGSAVAEAIAGCDVSAPVEMVGMKDRHAESGPYDELLRLNGLDAAAIEKAVRRALSRKSARSAEPTRP